MQVAEILSDINSLRVCVSITLPSSERLPHYDKRVQAASWTRDNPTKQYDNADNMVQGHNEALALVNVHKNITGSDSTESGSASPDKSPADDKADLRRAKELVELHYEVKARHANGTVDMELSQARQDVWRVLTELSTV
ncbi:hypothetical protein N7471_008160 [Penicillium samsonianum]|uniref:uncharacterized protein n=1 Tax=Penicillium samsonianum TaxID=1882272 RepID=UPI002548D0E2|nr:uncharacterized protein N7471_008160 [Penicillium samsonianum]KAJ6132945.1 hypothetical protein N7471_008160 [Penicillium samsonianum]